MSNRLHTALAAAVVLALTSGVAFADPTTFAGTFSVTPYTGTNHGLTIDATPNSYFGGGANANFSLAEGQSTGAHSLFNIYTPEGSVEHDDKQPKQIKVDFTFTEPSPSFHGQGTGTTVGQTSELGFYQDGKLTWDNNGVFDIAYPGGGDGDLQVALTGGTFANGSWWGLNDCDGLTVDATFTNVKDPTSVPEPASLALFGVGLLGLGMVAKRRRTGDGAAA